MRIIRRIVVLFGLLCGLWQGANAADAAREDVYLNAAVDLSDVVRGGTPYRREYPLVFDMTTGVSLPFSISMGAYIPVIAANNVDSFFRGVKIDVDVKAVSDGKVYFTAAIENGVADERKGRGANYLQQSDVHKDVLTLDGNAVIGILRQISIEQGGETRYVLSIRFNRSDVKNAVQANHRN